MYGTRMVRGRGFAHSDDQPGPAVVILIDRAMAQKYWPDKIPSASPQLLFDSVLGAMSMPASSAWRKNAPINQIGELPEPYLYCRSISPNGRITFALETG